MSSRNLRNILAAFAITVAACGSPPPSAVDEELLLVDIEACARGDSICERSGTVAPAELLVEGNHATLLWARPDCGSTTCDRRTQECCGSPLACVNTGTCTAAKVPAIPARISLPVLDHALDARLAWIAIGVVAGEPVRTLHVKIDGQDETIVQPVEGWARVEVSGRDRQVAPGARLEITATDGVFAIAWIVGRWKR